MAGFTSENPAGINRNPQLRAGKDKSVLLAGTDFVYEEIPARFASNRRVMAGNAFFIEKLVQQTSNHPAGGVDRMGITAQPFGDARYIDRDAPTCREGLRPARSYRPKSTGRRPDSGVIVALSIITWFEARTDPRLRRFDQNKPSAR